MVAAIGVVALDVAVEDQAQSVGMENREVVRLAEGVHGQFPVAFDVVGVLPQVVEAAEVPVGQFR